MLILNAFDALQNLVTVIALHENLRLRCLLTYAVNWIHRASRAIQAMRHMGFREGYDFRDGPDLWSHVGLCLGRPC